MTNFDLPRRLSEQIILVLTTTNSIPAENKGDYFNSETKTKHDKKVKVDSIILAVYVYHNLKRIFPYMYQLYYSSTFFDYLYFYIIYVYVFLNYFRNFYQCRNEGFS